MTPEEPKADSSFPSESAPTRHPASPDSSLTTVEVSTLGASPRQDPWAHRRAEPRTFAFIWTLFLFAATLTTYAVTMSMGTGSHDVVRPAARLLLAIVAAGIMLVWPMVRLSQLPDPRPISGPVLDLLVVLVPVQAIIWPQCLGWLAWWPVPVIAAAGASLCAWALIVGALLSISHTLRASGRFRSPSGWMAAFLLFTLLTLIPTYANARAKRPQTDPAVQLVRPSWMVSPISSMYEFTQDRTSVPAPAAVYPGHWRIISLTLAVGIFLWPVAIGVHRRALAGRPAPGLH